MAAEATMPGVAARWVRPGFGFETEGGRFRGYASLFGVVDQGRDMVEPGAFAASLARKGAGAIRMLFQHDPGQPIGRWLEVTEDPRGLRVEGELSPGVARLREVLELMRAGAVDGLSIGFRTVRAARAARGGVRRILEADLWEVSVVTFPMLPGARVEEIKLAGPKDGRFGDEPPGQAPQELIRTIRTATQMMQGKECRP